MQAMGNGNGTHTEADAGAGLAALAATLRQASRTLDALWRDAIDGHDGARLVALGDASHGLHLALIALEDGEADQRALVA